MAARKVGVTQPTIACWKQEDGELWVDQENRLKELEPGNIRLRRVVANQSLAKEYGRSENMAITEILRTEGRYGGRDRVDSIWRKEELKDRDPVWTYDFVTERTRNGRPIKILNIGDENTRERLT